MATAAPAQRADQKDKTNRVQGVNLTGMTKEEMRKVIARVSQDPEVVAIMEAINGTSNEEKVSVMSVAKKGLAYNDAGVLGPFNGVARYVHPSEPCLPS